LVQGYLASAGEFLNRAERDHLAFSAGLITFEIGVRFPDGLLAGDVYFKTHRPNHNLDRCRVQFKMVASFERHADENAGDCPRRLLAVIPQTRTPNASTA